MNLDQVLAFDVKNYENEYRQMRNVLDEFIKNRDIQDTSIITEVVPAADGLKSWLRVFSGSVQEPDRRLNGSTRMRVCFAERGMFLLMTLLESVKNELQTLQSGEDRERMRKLRRILIDFMRSVLGCEKRGLTFMKNWFSTLVDITPLELRSHNTTLTTENIQKLDLFCAQTRK